MSVRYPLRLFFDCSTAHLSRASRDYLAHRAACGEVDDDVPADLAAVMRHARTLDADYILFDADAEISGVLTTFDWPE